MALGHLPTQLQAAYNSQMHGRFLHLLCSQGKYFKLVSSHVFIILQVVIERKWIWQSTRQSFKSCIFHQQYGHNTNLSGFYDIKITASDGQSGINTIKYASGSRIADYFATEGVVVSNNVIRVTENGTYTVCAEDKAGNRTVKTVTINKIDITGPTTTAPTYTKTANSITVTNSQADSESGIYKVEYAIKESGGEYGDWQSSNEFTGLRSSTTYVIKTRAINKAYLKSESSETTVTTDIIEYTITLDDQGATTSGTPSIYEIYENRYSLASGGVAMTPSTNPITKPEKTGHQFMPIR